MCYLELQIQSKQEKVVGGVGVWPFMRRFPAGNAIWVEAFHVPIVLLCSELMCKRVGIILLGSLQWCYPRFRNRDLGHPDFVGGLKCGEPVAFLRGRC